MRKDEFTNEILRGESIVVIGVMAKILPGGILQTIGAFVILVPLVTIYNKCEQVLREKI